MSTVTVSFSIDDTTKKNIERLARKTKKSRSDIVRDMFAFYRAQVAAQALQDAARPTLRRLGLETEDQITAHAKR